MSDIVFLRLMLCINHLCLSFAIHLNACSILNDPRSGLTLIPNWTWYKRANEISFQLFLMKISQPAPSVRKQVMWPVYYLGKKRSPWLFFCKVYWTICFHWSKSTSSASVSHPVSSQDEGQINGQGWQVADLHPQCPSLIQSQVIFKTYNLVDYPFAKGQTSVGKKCFSTPCIASSPICRSSLVCSLYFRCKWLLCWNISKLNAKKNNLFNTIISIKEFVCTFLSWNHVIVVYFFIIFLLPCRASVDLLRGGE